MVAYCLIVLSIALLSFMVIRALFSVAIVAIIQFRKKKYWLDPSRPKLPPGALFAIPDDLLADIYTIWLRLDDVGRLDSALCSNKWRPPFLRLVSTKVLRFLREEIDVLDSTYLCSRKHKALLLPALAWILKRGIHLASLNLATMHSAIGVIKSLADEGRLDKLENLNGCCLDNEIIAIVLDKSYGSLLSIDLGCKQTNMVRMALRCTRLEAFAAQGNESVADIVEIVQSCRKIRKLNLRRFGGRLLDLTVVASCRLLEHLDVGGCTAVSDAAIRTVIKSCPLLKYVNRYNSKETFHSVNIFRIHTNIKAVWRAWVLTQETTAPKIFYISTKTIENDTRIEALVVDFQELMYIDVDGTLHISDATFMKLMSSEFFK